MNRHSVRRQAFLLPHTAACRTIHHPCMHPYRNHAPRRSISPSFRSYVASQAILFAEANLARRSARVAHITRKPSHAPIDLAPSERAGPLKKTTTAAWDGHIDQTQEARERGVCTGTRHRRLELDASCTHTHTAARSPSQEAHGDMQQLHERQAEAGSHACCTTQHERTGRLYTPARLSLPLLQVALPPL